MGMNCLSRSLPADIKDPQTGRKFAQEGKILRRLRRLGGGGRQSRPGTHGQPDRCHKRLRGRAPGLCGRKPPTAGDRILVRPHWPGGSRELQDFGPLMKDYNGNEVRIHALYHNKYQSPTLEPRKGPPHWNFLELQFDPRGADPEMSLKIRNIIDPPSAKPRGGGMVDRFASHTGRLPSCALPVIKTLSDAAVYLAYPDGQPIRGARSLPDGTVDVRTLIDVAPGEPVLMTSTDGDKVDAQIVTTRPLK